MRKPRMSEWNVWDSVQNGTANTSGDLVYHSIMSLDEVHESSRSPSQPAAGRCIASLDGFCRDVFFNKNRRKARQRRIGTDPEYHINLI